MNPEKNMILIKGEIKTSEILSCKYNAEKKKIDVTFCNGRKKLEYSLKLMLFSNTALPD